MEVEIRKATMDDFKQLQALNKWHFDSEYGLYDKTLNINWPFEKDGIKFFEDSITKKDKCAFIAVDNNKLIGYCLGMIYTPNSYRCFKKMAELVTLFIDDKYRNKGIGKKLLDKFLAWCKEKKIKRVKIEANMKNTKAHKFYHREGFKDFDLILERDI